MFTGLIETVGTVEQLQRGGSGGRLRISASWPDRKIPSGGDSVAVDGACLTVVAPHEGGFSADLSPETLDQTLLGTLRTGSEVNLERALELGGRLGGHIVQGHVDTVVRMLSIRTEGGFQRWRLTLPGAQSREVASKGSITLNGVSLTVAALGADWFEVALIPATLDATTLGKLRQGESLHVETDVLAKYVAQRMDGSKKSALDEIFGGDSGA